jgi:hypothetical protein
LKCEICGWSSEDLQEFKRCEKCGRVICNYSCRVDWVEGRDIYKDGREWFEPSKIHIICMECAREIKNREY